MAEIITEDDIPADVIAAAGDRLAVMLAGANARATRVAPCLDSTDPAPSVDQIDEAKLVLLGAVTRWVQSGAGAFTQQTAGPFSVSSDTRQRAGYNLWPSEIGDLQAICKDANDNVAYSVDTVPSCGTHHAETCSLAFGALYCSCGADLAGEPILGAS